MKPRISEITDEWLEKNRPCQEALEWWDRKVKDPIKILELLIKAKKYDWANWFIVRVMTYHDYVSYAVFAAEQVIEIYERRYPGDNRPRNAIKAAKKCIEDPSKENKKRADAAWDAARDAAWDAARAAAGDARAAAWDAARAAARAAAGDAARDAAWDAAWDARAAAGDAARDAMQLKILKYGMKLLTTGGPHAT